MRMLVLAMTAFGASSSPAILFKLFDNILHFHTSSILRGSATSSQAQ